ncbi:hypothetical protein FQR65_LT09669 [Abscondita terminalis]|nr:hypothetical protein FQR65_LT09669 [Abscondita terminalis]
MKICYLFFLCICLNCVFAEYCYYRKNENSSYLDCEYVDVEEPIEGISLIHLQYNTTITVIEKNLLSQFKNLKTLFLTAANIKKIESEAFKNHSSLEMIDLYHNKLEVIENGTFSEQKELKYLDLSYNMFKTLTSTMLSGLISLEWLSLNSNQLKLIDGSAFKETPKLKALFLRFNLIESLDAKSFKKLSELETLDLSANALKTIPVGLFSGQTKLNTLMLQYNSLQIIPNNTFDSTSELTWLDVSFNNISKFPEDLLARTNKLEVLRINNNNFTDLNATVLISYTPKLREFNYYSIPIDDEEASSTTKEDLKNTIVLTHMDGYENQMKYNIKFIKFTDSSVPIIYQDSFSDYKTLTQLYLNSTFVEKIEPGAFNNLQSLQNLHLDKNKISKISRKALSPLKSLIFLNLTDNNIQTIEENSFLNLNQLQVLLLSHNKLQYVSPDYFAGLNALNLLNLSHNSIFNVTGIFNRETLNTVANLTIDLSFNAIKNVNFSVFPFDTEYINLRDNQISIITNESLLEVTTLLLASNRLLFPPPISKSLKHLDLGNNSIKTLDLGLFYSINLEHLDLSNNLVTRLHENLFDNLTNLKYLNLSNNRIEYIPTGLFQSQVSLQHLNISGNKLSEIEYGTFVGLENVKYLDISNNSLTRILESTFYPLVNLRNLLLDDNFITTINSNDLLEHLQMLKYVSLNNNLWNCKSLLNAVTLFRKNKVAIATGTNKKITNINGIACSIDYTTTKQIELTTTEANYYGPPTTIDYKWDKFKNFFDQDFYNTSFYEFVKNRFNTNFEEKLLNIFNKHITETLNFTLSKLTSNFKEVTADKISKYVKSIPSPQPVFEKLSSNFEERVKWLFYIFMFVGITMKESEALCSIESVKSSTQVYGNYYDSRGNYQCCYHYPTLYDYILCINTPVKSAQDLYFPGMVGYNGKITYKVKYIKFDNSSIPTIYTGIFSNFKNISGLYLNASSVHNIELGAFNYLENLEVLSLDQNNITEITKGLFNHLTSLISLNLTDNNIKSLEKKSFWGLNMLETLLLSHNKLKSICSDHFLGLKSLKLLNLSHNNILNLTITLDNNDSSSLNNLAIDLSFNSLKNVNFSVIPSEVSDLNLENNQISTVSGNVPLRMLKFSLASNKLLISPKINPSLQHLNLSKNSITTLDVGLFYSNNLTHLDLSSNFIESLHEAIFDNLTDLQILNLQNNQIYYIPVGLFQALISLQYLNISGNKLSEFEYGTFLGLQNLESLDISNNSLAYILESTLHPLISLTSLYIDHNLLTAIDSSDLLQHLKMLKYVSLNNNPWICKILLDVITKFRKSFIVVEEGSYKKTTNVNGIACFNYNKFGNQMELPSKSVNSNLDQNKFDNFFNNDFFNTSFYKFFKSNTNLDFEQKLVNIFQKQIGETLNYTLFKFGSSFETLEEDKFSKYLKSIPNPPPVYENLVSNNFEDNVLKNMSSIQNNVLLLYVTFVIIIVCLLVFFVVKTFHKSFKCFTKKNEELSVETESNAHLELL